MIVELEEAKRELVGMRPDIEELSQALHIQALTAKVEELEQTTLAPDFWGDQARSSRVLQTIKQSKDTIEEYTDLKSRLEDAIALAEMAIEENDEDSLPRELVDDRVVSKAICALLAELSEAELASALHSASA